MVYERAEVEALVRKVVSRTLGVSSKAAGAYPVKRRTILDAETVRQMPSGSVQEIAADVLITPLARQIALERHIRLQSMDGDQPTGSGSITVNNDALAIYSSNQASRVVAFGAEQGGSGMKETLKGMMETDARCYSIID
mgnify:CR=1 FL=1